MTDTSANNKRIAKNTMLLYVRMLLLMVVSLYTSRIVLDALGAADFGIYNVVGGVIGMMSFFNNTMATAIQRFLNIEIGKGNHKILTNIFSTSIIYYGIIILFVIILGETIGLWFVKNKLTIPSERQEAAFWIYQFSLLTFIFNMISIPYNAVIIAYEKMATFAYISIFEALGKLSIAFLIIISPIDRLIFYSILILCSSFIILQCYIFYCHRAFPSIRLKWIWDTKLLKQIFIFSGWMITGTVAQIFSTQGINILLNIFFGPIYNASRAIGIQVYNAVNQFVINFTVASKPQIIKSYVQNNMLYTYKLVFTTSKLAFYLLFILSIPIIFETDYILKLWLKDPPLQASLFTQLIIFDLYITIAYNPLGTLSQASGKIKYYQLIIAGCFLISFIITWILFHLGFPPYSCFLVVIAVNLLGLFARLIELRKNILFPIKKYLFEVIKPIMSVLTISLFFTSVISYIIISSTIYIFLLKSLLYILITVSIIYFIGINEAEKNYIRKIILKKKI